jgi:hypothetical protein
MAGKSNFGHLRFKKSLNNLFIKSIIKRVPAAKSKNGAETGACGQTSSACVFVSCKNKEVKK